MPKTHKANDPFNNIFSMLSSLSSIYNSLNKLFTHFNIEQTCLVNCNIVLKPFIAGYKWINEPNNKISRSCRNLYTSLHKHLKSRSKDTADYLNNSDFTPLVSFWIKVIWSKHYVINHEYNK